MSSSSKVFFSLSLILIFFFVCLRIKVHEEDFNYQINGRIDSVSYDIKGNPTIIVKGEFYYLSDSDWLFNSKLQKGDVIEKKSKTMTIKLTRPYTGEVIFIKEASPVF